MNQAELTHLVSGIRVRLGPARQKFPNAEGYRGNLYALREMVSALVASERVELSRTKGELTRQYTERLIAEAVMHGDRHRRTMEVAQWWLKDDKSAVHKLFKVRKVTGLILKCLLHPGFSGSGASLHRLHFKLHPPPVRPLPVQREPQGGAQ